LEDKLGLPQAGWEDLADKLGLELEAWEDLADKLGLELEAWEDRPGLELEVWEGKPVQDLGAPLELAEALEDFEDKQAQQVNREQLDNKDKVFKDRAALQIQAKAAKGAKGVKAANQTTIT
jgi:hypothetical protein